MLELKYDNKIHLDKWDIDVIPYLSMKNMESIINHLISCENGLQREMALIADILVACTDIYSDKKADYTYEEILYSGLWDDIMEACPYLRANVDKIKSEVDDVLSVKWSLIKLIDSLTEKVQSIDYEKLNIDEIVEAIKLIISKAGE